MKDRLGAKKTLLLGSALFSMHFGAMSMLFPVTWGLQSGASVLWAYAGVFLTIVLLPFLGYRALERSGDSFLAMTQRVSPRFAAVFCTLTALILGPLYVIPRMGAATRDALLQLLPGVPSGRAAEILFSLAFYALVYWFLLSGPRVMERIAHILFPILLLIMAANIGRALLTPAGTLPAKTYAEPAVLYGFLNGYATGDLQCALLFGLVVINSLKNSGVRAEKRNVCLFRVSLVGLGLLGLAHLGHMLVGARYAGTTDLTLARLYTRIVLGLWGSAGGFFFGAALLAACLSSTVGITASSVWFCMDEFRGRFRYRRLALAACAVSAVIACFDLSGIISWVGPILDLLYPPAIVIALHYALMPDPLRPSGIRGLRFAVAASCGAGLLNLAQVYLRLLGADPPAFSAFCAALPLASDGLFWIPAAAAAFLAGSLTGPHEKT